MTGEFEIKTVALEVLAHLERRREAVVRDESATALEVQAALGPVRRAYEESQLPQPYFESLQRELESALPAAWRAIAVPFSDQEARGFGVWRGGDLVARLTYVLAGLALGGLIVWLPFIPVWEKWIPFAMAAAGVWLPDAQAMWQRRRYARQLGHIAARLAKSQRTLEACVTLSDLLPPTGGRS